MGAGMIGVYYSFYKFNLFLESNVKPALEDLYVINPQNMMVLYYRNFSKHIELMSSNQMELVSGGIIGIESLLQTISQASSKEKLKLIEQNDSFIYLEHTPHVLLVLVVNQRLHSVLTFLHELGQRWDAEVGLEKIEYENLSNPKTKKISAMVDQVFHIQTKVEDAGGWLDE